MSSGEGSQMTSRYAAVGLILVASLTASAADTLRPPVDPVVEVEETVYQYEDAKNGAGPTWCVGSTCLVRMGGNVFASGLETLKQFEPLNNVRWLLFKREAEGWRLQRADPKDRTREPCPLACFRGGPLLMSVNPGVDIDRLFSYKYARVRDGQVVERRALLQERSNTAKRFPYQHGNPRLHVTPDSRLFAVYHVMANGPDNRVHENHLMELYPDGTQSQPVTLPLKHPFSRFFTATPRAGCAPSYTLDLLGTPTDMEQTIGYVRIRLR